MTKVNKEADSVNNEEDKIYKQGNKRKVKESNFYLICEYLKKKNIFPAPLFYDDEVSDELAFLRRAPAKSTSKEEVENTVKLANSCIKQAKCCIEMQRFDDEYKDQEDCEADIALWTDIIEKDRASYRELTDKEMYELHTIIMKLDDKTYAAMTSWIKQVRHRKKNKGCQVTLSEKAKYSLEFLKKNLGTADYNETLIQLHNELYEKLRKSN
jgi:hypothetical protein